MGTLSSTAVHPSARLTSLHLWSDYSEGASEHGYEPAPLADSGEELYQPICLYSSYFNFLAVKIVYRAFIAIAVGAVCCLIFYPFKGTPWDLSKKQIKESQEVAAAK